MSESYQLIDSGDFRKLELIGNVSLSRPSPQAVWATGSRKGWKTVQADYERFTGGGGKWHIKKDIPESWNVTVGPNIFAAKLTDFGHLGFFPEQAKNWFELEKIIAKRMKKIPDFNVLNLFAYTGGSTLSCARAGAKVVHVDASKTSVSWARENADLNGLSDKPVRWIVDDVQKFVAREVRRKNRYQGIILDPPSFGRGAHNEVWKIEEHLVPLLKQLSTLMAEDFQFMLISGHSNGYTPAAFINLVGDCTKPMTGKFQAEEMLVEERDTKRNLPSGASCLFLRD